MGFEKVYIIIIFIKIIIKFKFYSLISKLTIIIYFFVFLLYLIVIYFLIE